MGEKKKSHTLRHPRQLLLCECYRDYEKHTDKQTEVIQTRGPHSFLN